MNYIVITGVSSGIGYGAAKEFASHGYHVFGSTRQMQDAARLKAEIGTNFTPLLFDITDGEAVKEAARQVEVITGKEGITGLINNAGIATCGPLMHQPLDEIRSQFEVNVIGQISVIQAFLPLLGARKSMRNKPGRILNISSVGGKLAAPFLGAYAGSKHAMEGISQSLRRELQLYGIDVIIIGPGAVNTSIWDKETVQDLSKYSQTDYAESLEAFQKYAIALGLQGYSPEMLGKFLRKVFETQKPKTRYTILPHHLRDWTIPILLPARWLDKLIGKNIGLLRK